MNLDDFVYVKEDSLSEEFCRHCIEKFNNDSGRYQGVVHGGVYPDTKKTIDLTLSDKDHWKEEDDVFFKSINSHLGEYLNFVPESKEVLSYPQDTGYQIQRYDPGDFYTWHQDQWTNRRITFIWYLNDITEDGYTEFSTGLKVQPKTGKLLMFPALWPWMHRGYPPKSETKYICTGWMYSRKDENSNADDR